MCTRPCPAAEHSRASKRGNLDDRGTALDTGHAALSPGRSQPPPRVHCRTSVQTYPAQWWGNVIPEGLGFMNAALFLERTVLLQKYSPVLGLFWFLTCPHHSSSPHSSVGKESTCNAGDPSSSHESGRSAEEGIGYPLQYSWASLVAQLVKNSPAIQETWVQFLGWEDSLEESMATHFSILAWRIPWTI